jgi:hypothetical protein
MTTNSMKTNLHRETNYDITWTVLLLVLTIIGVARNFDWGSCELSALTVVYLDIKVRGVLCLLLTSYITVLLCDCKAKIQANRSILHQIMIV